MTPQSSSAPALYEISRAADARSAVSKALGNTIDKITHVYSGRILIWIYISPEKTAGGIIIPETKKKEDVYQGQVGLVLKKGAQAFKDDKDHQFHGQDVKVGDWVTFTPGNGKRIQINGVDCRWIEDTLIDAVVSDPSIVTHK